MDGLAADVLHAWRIYAKTPVASVLAVLMLAVSIAIVASFLSLWSDLALKPVPGFEDGTNLITITQTDGRRLNSISYALIERINEEMSSIDSIAGTFLTGQSYDREGESTRLIAELVTADYFSEFDPKLQLGRGFELSDHESDAAPVIVVSDRFWKEQFGGRPDVLGKTLLIHGPDMVIRTADGEARAGEKLQDYRIVGVMAPEMTGTFYSAVQVWMPYEQAAELFFGDAGPGYRRFTQLQAVARLAPGTSVSAVRNELVGRYGDAGQALGIAADFRLDAVRGVVANLNTHRETLRQVRLFLAGSLLLALVAACNVSLFLLSRAPGRRRELAIRMSVGARPKRLARQLVTEASVLVAAATALGVLASLWLVALLIDLPLLRSAQWRDVTVLDWHVLGIVVGLTLLLTVLVALAPVAGLGRLSLAAGSRAVSARASMPQRIAGFTQIVVATVIASVAVAFLWYLSTLDSIDRGFDAPGVYFAQVQPPDPPRDLGATTDVARLAREQRRQALLSIPGIDAVAFGTTVPGASRQTNYIGLHPPEAQEDEFRTELHTIDHEYLKLIGARLLDGRFFAADDRDAVVINRALAERLWHRTNIAGEILPTPSRYHLQWEVIGVVGDIAYEHPSDDPRPMVFHTDIASAWFEWPLIESKLSAAQIRQAMQDSIDAGNLELKRIYNVRNLEDAWNAQLAPDRSRVWLTVAAAVVVTALGAFGYYGTQRFLVAAGRREYAILAALGAGPRALGRLVIGRGLAFGLPGLVFGALGAFIVVAWLRGDFISADVPPLVITVVVTVTMALMLLASAFGPARLARRTDPGPLLKEE